MKKMGELKDEVERQFALILELLEHHDEYDDEFERMCARSEETEEQNRSLKDDLILSKNEIQEMNKYIYQLHMEKVEMKTEFELSKKHAEEKLVELQNEVERQMLLIADLGEEKKKIICQFGVGYLLLVYVVASVIFQVSYIH